MDILKEILSEAKEQPMFEQADESFTQDDESTGSQPETKETDPSQEGEKATPTKEAEDTKAEAKVEPKSEEGEDNTLDEKATVRLDKIPRFKEVIKQRNEERERSERLEKELSEIKQMLSKDKEVSNVPQWFKEQYAEYENVDELWTVYETENKRAIDQAAHKAKELMEQENTQKEQDVQTQRQWVDDQLSALSEATGVNFSDPNVRYELLKVVDDYGPTDSNGNYDFEKAYKIYQVLQEKKTEENLAKGQARKEIASQTTTDSSPAPTQKTVFTSQDIRKSGGDLWGLLKNN
jgi:hypothetical protein